MSTQSLYDYVNEMGYCRNHFRSLVESQAREIHKAQLGTCTNTIKNQTDIPNGYWVWWTPDSQEHPILVRKTTRGIKTLDEYAKTHLVSSVIKNIFLDDSIDDNRLKGNTAVYIFYYHAMYNSYDTPDAAKLTESVTFYISSTIKTMIDKELTLYRDHLEIAEFIDIMRIRLNMERTVDRARSVNLRM